MLTWITKCQSHAMQVKMFNVHFVSLKDFLPPFLCPIVYFSAHVYLLSTFTFSNSKRYFHIATVPLKPYFCKALTSVLQDTGSERFSRNSLPIPGEVKRLLRLLTVNPKEVFLTNSCCYWMNGQLSFNILTGILLSFYSLTHG